MAKIAQIKIIENKSLIELEKQVNTFLVSVYNSSIPLVPFLHDLKHNGKIYFATIVHYIN